MMEKLTEEAGKLTDTASKFSDEAGRIVLDRFKNPYIIAFTISWIIFNWQPISIFLLSKNTIEERIGKISFTYTDILFNLLFPILSVLFYMFVLPRINKYTEVYNYKNDKERADHASKLIIDKIERSEKVAIADDKRQNAVRNAREGADHNKFVEELQSNIDFLQTKITEERENVQSLILEKEELNSKHAEMQKKLVDLHNKDFNEMLEQLNNEKDRYKSLMDDNKWIISNRDEIKHELAVEKFINSRYKNPHNKIISTDDDTFLEYFNEINEIRFFDLKRKELISRKDAFRAINGREIDYEFDEVELDDAFSLLRNSIT